MTNTLHRFGDAESFRDDYVVFAIASRGRNDQDAVPKLRRFLELAVPFKPVNLGDATHGGALRPSKHMSPTSHWKRDMTPDLRSYRNVHAMSNWTLGMRLLRSRCSVVVFANYGRFVVKAFQCGLSPQMMAGLRCLKQHRPMRTL